MWICFLLWQAFQNRKLLLFNWRWVKFWPFGSPPRVAGIFQSLKNFSSTSACNIATSFKQVGIVITVHIKAKQARLIRPSICRIRRQGLSDCCRQELYTKLVIWLSLKRVWKIESKFFLSSISFLFYIYNLKLYKQKVWAISWRRY